MGVCRSGARPEVMCMVLTIERACVSPRISRLAARIGTVKTEGLFAADNMLNNTVKEMSRSSLLWGFAYGSGRRTSFFWFSGNKFFTPFLFLSEPKYSVLNSSLILAFVERAWWSSVLTLREESLGEAGQWVEFGLHLFPALGPG